MLVAKGQYAIMSIEQDKLHELARRYNLSSYDAAYLELVMRHGLPIACQDGKLKEAALQAGVELL